MRDIQNYNMEHVDTLAPDTIKESVMCRHSQLSLLLADIQGRISNAPEGSLRTARKAHGCQYYHKVEVNDTKGTYIKKHNYNLAIELAQKDYDLRKATYEINQNYVTWNSNCFIDDEHSSFFLKFTCN